jgi:alkylation response protein AidB-like acyl-CoA dehydrogenase
MRLWVEAEAVRLSSMRLEQVLAAGRPGPEGSGAKLAYARLNQAVSSFELELLGQDGLLYDDWQTDTWRIDRPIEVDFFIRSPGFRYLRARANSIEGGSSEIQRNIIAERVLGLPREQAADAGVPWKDTAR